MQITISRTKSGRFAILINCEPSRLVKHDFLEPAASAYPRQIDRQSISIDRYIDRKSMSNLQIDSK